MPVLWRQVAPFREPQRAPKRPVPRLFRRRATPFALALLRARNRSARCSPSGAAHRTRAIALPAPGRAQQHRVPERRPRSQPRGDGEVRHHGHPEGGRLLRCRDLQPCARARAGRPRRHARAPPGDRPGRRAYLPHPIAADRARTYEDPTIVTPSGRRRAFGQEDHVRLYGRDFTTRLEAAGFSVTVRAYAEELWPAERRHYGVHGDPIYIGR